MSYIRFSWPMVYVEGDSKSYVIETNEGIKSYGHDNAGLIEMLCTQWKTDDEPFKAWLVQELSDVLGVTLRKKKLSREEWMDKAGGNWKKLKELIQSDERLKFVSDVEIP